MLSGAVLSLYNQGPGGASGFAVQSLNGDKSYSSRDTFLPL